MTKVMVLNNDFSPLSFTTWQRAVTLVYLGRAELVKAKDRVLRNAEKTYTLKLPSVIRLLKYVRQIFKNKVPYSKANIIHRDNKCMYCGSTNHGDLTIDHVIPKSRGGASNWENCVAACKTCNNKKGDRTPREANMRLLKQPVAPTINEFIQIKMKQMGISGFLDDLYKSMT